MRRNFILLILLLWISASWANNPTSVPLHDPVYHFLERMEALGFAQDVFNGIKPYSRTEVANYLKQVVMHRMELTSIDRRKLDDFLLDYRWELRKSKKNPLVPKGKNWYSFLSSWQNFKNDFKRFFQQNYPEEQNHVFLWETDSSNFYFDFLSGYNTDHRSDALHRSVLWWQYNLRGVLYENFGYQALIRFENFYGNNDAYVLKHPMLKGSWSETSDYKAHFSDHPGGEIVLHLKYFDLQFAQQPISWGYGESGKLILSDNTEPYPYISISKNWGWFKFIALHGKLQSFPQDTLHDGYVIYPDKWLAAQRLELSLWHKVTLGFNECFIYGERYADWEYMLPFNFYRAVQHKLRDRDNATISLDMEWLAHPGIILYGTVFLDEFRQKKLFTNWYGNKHAFSAGIWLVDPLHLPNLSLRFEYTAIMPWVYTHKYLINAYTSDYRSIGYWAGPNSEVWYFHLRKDLHPRLQTGFKYQQWKHGENYPNKNIGGNILQGHLTLLGTQTKPVETRKFLEGILNTTRTFQLYAKYEIFNGFYLSAAWTFTDYKRENIDKKYQTLNLGAALYY